MPRCFEKIINDRQLTRTSSGEAGILHMLCALGRDLATDADVLENPYSELKRRLFLSTGDQPMGYRETISAYIGSLENCWAQNH